MREIQHPNLCAFVGAIIENPRVAILTELCGKGSLLDILANDDMDIGWDFKYSMLKVSISFASVILTNQLVLRFKTRTNDAICSNNL